MAKTTREQQLAHHMLAHREKGYSVGYVIRQSAWRYLALIVLAAGMLAASLTTGDRVARGVAARMWVGPSRRGCHRRLLDSICPSMSSKMTPGARAFRPQE